MFLLLRDKTQSLTFAFENSILLKTDNSMIKHFILTILFLFLLSSCGTVQNVTREIDPWTKEVTITSELLVHGTFNIQLKHGKGRTFAIFSFGSREDETIYTAHPDFSNVNILMSDSTILKFSPAFETQTKLEHSRSFGLIYRLYVYCPIDMPSLEKLRDYEIEMIRFDVSPAGVTRVADKECLRLYRTRAIAGDFINELTKKEP